MKIFLCFLGSMMILLGLVSLMCLGDVYQNHWMLIVNGLFWMVGGAMLINSSDAK